MAPGPRLLAALAVALATAPAANAAQIPVTTAADGFAARSHCPAASPPGLAGVNTIRFTGLIGGRPLAPGPHTLVLTLPRTAAAKAVVATRAFRIAR